MNTPDGVRLEASQGLSDLLLVDDDDIFSTIMARSLNRHGFAVRAACSYEEAIERVRDTAPEYAVVDLKIPGGSGLMLVRQLVAANKNARVVVLTGYASIATAIEAIKMGAQYYLTKPATAEEIVASFYRGAGQGTLPVSDVPLSVDRLEWEHINRVLTQYNGNISATARALGMYRRTLQRKLGKHPVRR